MGADDDIHRAVGHAADNFRSVPAGSRQQGNVDRPIGEAIGEVAIVLFGQQGRGGEHGDLATGFGHGKSRAQCDFGLAETDIATDHAIHWLIRGQISQDRVDRIELIVGFFVLESGGESGLHSPVKAVGVAFPRCPSGLKIQQLGGNVADLLRGLASGLAPLIGAEPIEFDLFRVRAGIATDQMQVGHRDVELVASVILEGQVFTRGVGNVQHFKAQIATDAVLQVDHQRASLQIGQRFDHALRVLSRASLPPQAAGMAGEKLGFGQYGPAAVGQGAAAGYGHDRQAEGALTAGKGLPGFHQGRAQSGGLERLIDQFAATCGIGGEQDAAGQGLELFGSSVTAVVQIDLWRWAERGAGRLASGQANLSAFLEHLQQSIGWDVDLVRQEYRAFAIAAALLMAADELQVEFTDGLLDAGQQHEAMPVGKIIEQ